MSIWDRIARVARAELQEMKRVLSDRDEPVGTPEEARQRAIREAEGELERAERDINIARQEMGSYGWEAPGARPATTPGELESGAALWGQDPAAPRERDGAASAASSVRAAASQPVEERREIPNEVRDAYAALELPLGADTAAIDASHAALTARFHPDRFGADPDRLRIADLVRSRIDAARQITLSWLETRKN